MGKLEERFIKEVIAKEHGYFRPNVVAPSYGLDTSIIKLTETLAMTVASDPLSYIPRLGAEMSAWLSLQLVANDIATTSLSPEYGQLVLNLPENISQKELSEYWYYIDFFAKEIGITITGGHTGWAHSNKSTIAGGITLWAVGQPQTMLSSSMAAAGDTLLMTKSAAISSSSILASVFPKYSGTHLSLLDLTKVKNEIWNISVLKEARIVSHINAQERIVTAMHDVTEGGILGAVYEMCSASEVGILLDANKIYIEPHIQMLCTAFQLDPLRCIGAGSMLISCKTDYKDVVIDALESAYIRCTEIGRFTDVQDGLYITADNSKEILNNNTQDPYWDVFNQSMQNGRS